MPDPITTWSVNPLALAELITGQVFPGGSMAAAQQMLADAFKVKWDMVFEGEGGDASRLDLFQDVVNALRNPRLLADILADPRVQPLVSAYGIALIERIMPYLLPVVDATFPLPGASAPAKAVVAGTYRDISGIGDYVRDGVSYLDPLQGNVADCYLIASMISLAWSRPAEWARDVAKSVYHEGSEATYRYAFYSGRKTREPALAIAPRLPVGGPGQSLVYGHSAGGGEVWAGMIEKAFVVRESHCGHDDPSPAQYQEIANRMAPQIACRTLAGGSCHCDELSALDGDVLPASLRNRCDERGVTSVPTMAWTHATAEGMQPLTWKATGLVRNHVYAVLGIMKRDAGQFVVLRNPWGDLPYYPDGYARGTWKPGAGACGAGEVELNSDGVIAIAAEWFNRCFMQFGWVDPIDP